jgi:hypothetical protein
MGNCSLSCDCCGSNEVKTNVLGHEPSEVEGNPLPVIDK